MAVRFWSTQGLSFRIGRALLVLVIACVLFRSLRLLLGPGVPSIRDSLADQALTGGGRGVTRCVAFDNDGSVVAAGDDSGTVTAWETRDGAKRASMVCHNGAVTCLAFSPNGAILASGGEDRNISIWDVRANKLIKTLGTLEASVNSVASHRMARRWPARCRGRARSFGSGASARGGAESSSQKRTHLPSQIRRISTRLSLLPTGKI